MGEDRFLIILSMAKKMDHQKLTDDIAAKGGLKVGREAYAQYGDPIFRASMIGDFFRAGKRKLGFKLIVAGWIAIVIGFSLYALMMLN